MPTPTYNLIDSVTLGSSASSVTFSSIDQSYGDLVLVAEFGYTSTGANLSIRFNGDTGSNYSKVGAYGDGSTAASYTSTSTFFFTSEATTPTATYPANQLTVFQALDYSATDKHKPVLYRSNNASRGTNMEAGRWANTSAITSITALTTFNQFSAGSTFHLYGIEA